MYVIQKYCAIADFIYNLHVLCQKWWIKDVQPISNSIANALEWLQFCTKPSISSQPQACIFDTRPYYTFAIFEYCVQR